MVKMNLLLVLLSFVILESCSGYPIEEITLQDKLLENATAVEIFPSSNVSVPQQVQYANKVIEKIKEKIKDVKDKIKGGIDKIKEKFKKGDGGGSNDDHDPDDRYDRFVRITSDHDNSRSGNDLDNKPRMILLGISLSVCVCFISYLVYLKYKEYSEEVAANSKSQMIMTYHIPQELVLLFSAASFKRYRSPQVILTPSFFPRGRHLSSADAKSVLGIKFCREHPSQTGTQGIFFMPYNHTTGLLSTFCIRKIHRLGPGSNPQPWVQKARDKPTTPPS
ncbi:hypothetical protein TNCV_164962 [Trichonephila clavipes]|nr:hypothetical protein TNCV_164962 [Trichonephila clavipes]